MHNLSRLAAILTPLILLTLGCSDPGMPSDSATPTTQSSTSSGETAIIIDFGPKVFLQKIESPDGKTWFALFVDSAGFGDPAWYLYRFPVTTDVESIQIERGTSDPGIIFWNYSEGGDHTDNPAIQLVQDRYIVFTRGGLHHSLYDIHENKALVNNTSPYHALIYSDEYEEIVPRPSMEERKRMLAEWKIKNLHDPIRKIIGEDSGKGTEGD